MDHNPRMSEKRISLLWRIFRNPIAMRELRVAGRSLRIWVVYLVALMAQFIMVMLVASGYDTEGVIQASEAASIGPALFMYESIILLMIILAVVPAVSFRALVVERDAGSFDLLVLSNLQPWELILGKFFSSLAQSSLFILSALPVYGLAYSFGGLPQLLLWMTLFGFFVIATGLTAISLYFSTITTRPLAALVLSYGVAIAVAFLSMTVGGALLVDTIAGGSSIIDFLFSSDSTLSMLSLLGGATALSLILAFSFIASTSRVKTEAQNKWTPLRIFQSVAVLVSIVLLACSVPALNSSGLRANEFAGTFSFAIPVIVAALAIPLTFSMIKPIADCTFPARSIYRRHQAAMEKARLPMRVIRWLYLPGATSTYALNMLLLAIQLTGLFLVSTLVYLGPTAESASQHPIQSQEMESRAFPDKNFNIPSQAVAINQVEASINVDWEGSPGFQNPKDSYGFKLEKGKTRDAVLQPDETKYDDIRYESFRGHLHTLGSLAISVFWMAFCLGSLVWGLNFTKCPRRMITLVALLVLLAMLFLPSILDLFPPSVPFVGLLADMMWAISPVTLWQSCVALGHLETLEPLALSQRSLGLIDSARGTIYFAFARCYGVFALIFCLGLLIGLPARRRADAARKAAHDRSPVPNLPPPRAIKPRFALEAQAPAQAQAQAPAPSAQAEAAAPQNNGTPGSA